MARPNATVARILGIIDEVFPSRVPMGIGAAYVIAARICVALGYELNEDEAFWMRELLMKRSALGTRMTQDAIDGGTEVILDECARVGILQNADDAPAPAEMVSSEDNEPFTPNPSATKAPAKAARVQLDDDDGYTPAARRNRNHPNTSRAMSKQRKNKANREDRVTEAQHTPIDPPEQEAEAPVPPPTAAEDETGDEGALARALVGDLVAAVVASKQVEALPPAPEPEPNPLVTADEGKGNGAERTGARPPAAGSSPRDHASAPFIDLSALDEAPAQDPFATPEVGSELLPVLGPPPESDPFPTPPPEGGSGIWNAAELLGASGSDAGDSGAGSAILSLTGKQPQGREPTRSAPPPSEPPPPPAVKPRPALAIPKPTAGSVSADKFRLLAAVVAASIGIAALIAFVSLQGKPKPTPPEKEVAKAPEHVQAPGNNKGVEPKPLTPTPVPTPTPTPAPKPKPPEKKIDESPKVGVAPTLAPPPRPSVPKPKKAGLTLDGRDFDSAVAIITDDARLKKFFPDGLKLSWSQAYAVAGDELPASWAQAAAEADGAERDFEAFLAFLALTGRDVNGGDFKPAPDQIFSWMMVRRLAVYRAGDGKPFTQAEEFDPADVKALRKELLTKVGYIRDGKPSPEKFEAASAEFQRLCKLWRARAEELRAKK